MAHLALPFLRLFRPALSSTAAAAASPPSAHRRISPSAFPTTPTTAAVPATMARPSSPPTAPRCALTLLCLCVLLCAAPVCAAAPADPATDQQQLYTNGSDDSLSPEDEQRAAHLEAARWWHFCGALVAIVFCAAMIASYSTADRRQRLPPANLLRNRTISDLGNSLAYVVPAFHGIERSEASCELQGILIQFFSMASMVWWVTFSLELLWSVRNPFTDHASHLRIYHLLVWSLSIVSAIVLKASGKIGVTDLDFCWVDTNASVSLSMVIFYVPVALGYALSLSVLIWVSLTQKVAIPSSHRIRTVAISQNKWYIFLIGIFWTFSAVVWFGGFGNAVCHAAMRRRHARAL